MLNGKWKEFFLGASYGGIGGRESILVGTGRTRTGA